MHKRAFERTDSTDSILGDPLPDKDISVKDELVRKGIHLASLSIPVVYYFIPRQTTLEFLVPFLIFSVFVDVGRHYMPWLKRIVNKVFFRLLRPHERDDSKMLLSGATYVLISAALCVFIFPKLITVTAFSILIISDASSAIFGKMWGKHPFLDKSREGTMAFVVTAWIVVALAPKAVGTGVEYAIGAIAAVAGAVVEAASVRLRFDDNLSVPISVGFTMWGLYYLLDRVDPMHFHSLWLALMNFT